MNVIESIEIAQDFAHRAHGSIDQRRKYTGEPYHVHTDDVANIVFDTLYPADYTGLTEAEDVIALRVKLNNMVIAAHLHDYREDVVTKLFELKRFEELGAFELEYNSFPIGARNLVIELTDVYIKANYPHLNRRERHKLENDRLADISDDGQTVKLADIISNTPNIVRLDKGFARVFLSEITDLLPRLHRGDNSLFKRASELVAIEISELNKAN